MKISSFFLIVFLFLNINNNLQAQELKWYDWSEGMQKAKKENKVVLLDVYTDWCYWCKVMDKKTYSNEDIVKKIKKHFVPVKLNPEQNKNYTYNGKSYTGHDLINVLSESKFRGYPSTFFINLKLGKTSMIAGYYKPEDFTGILDQNLN